MAWLFPERHGIPQLMAILPRWGVFLRDFFFVWAIRPWVVLLFVKQWYQGLKMWKISPNISFAVKISFAKPFHTGLAKISAQHEHFPLVVCLNLAWPREATEWYQFSWWTDPFSDCRDPQIVISIRCALHLPIFHPFGPRIGLPSFRSSHWFATNISTLISLIRYDKPRSYSKSKNKKSAWPTFILFFLLNPGEVWISSSKKTTPHTFFGRFGHREKHIIELDDGKILHRKALYLMVKAHMGFRFSQQNQSKIPIFDGKNHGFRWRFSQQNQSKIGTELLVQRLPELLRNRCH